MRLIVDCDPLVYGMGFAAQGEPEHHAFNLVKGQLTKYMERFGSDDISCHLTGSRSSQWRPQLYPDYKASRLDKPKPEHYDAIRRYLIRHWNAKVSDGIEADDAVCLEAYTYKGYSMRNHMPEQEERDEMLPQCVIISIDKDLDQCPGWHFKPGTTRYPKDWYYYVDRTTAALWWGTQMLMGDDGDDIQGIPGIGPAKARDMMLKIDPECYDMASIAAEVSANYHERGLELDDYIKTEVLVSMIQDDKDYADVRERMEESINSEPSVAGEEVQDTSVQELRS